LLGALLPWAPILAELPLSRIRQDPRLSFLAVWAFSTFLFFSLASSKLPGYLLPALPPLAVLLGVGCMKLRVFWAVLAALMLALFPLAEAILPVALADGLEKAWPPANISPAGLGLALVAAAGVGWLVAAGRRAAAVTVLAGCTAVGFIHLKVNTFPIIDRRAGTRALWRQIEPRLEETCLGDVRRHVVYGLRYYSHGRLPLCTVEPRPLRVESDPAVLTDRSPYEAPARQAAGN
jgi:4-amino-4-deoxy-L-arabinose transferase-like glycosyltransferase